MAYYFETLLTFLSLILSCYLYRNKKGIPTNWPLYGMLPALLLNIHRIHTFLIEILEKSHLTFHFKGPWLTNMNILVTIDPSNIHHVMIKNFANYPKGSKFNEMFDVLGDGIFNADYLVWKYHRKMTHTFLTHPKFHEFLVKKTLDKVENGLIPVLNHVVNQEMEVDFQDLIARFTFDAGCMVMMDHDPKSLSSDFPTNAPSNALNDVEEVIFYRHVVPSFVWKFQRWLNLGQEKKYKKAWQTLDTFIYKCIAWKREEMKSMIEDNEECVSKTTTDQYGFNQVSADLLTLYIEDEKNFKTLICSKGDKFLRDTVLTGFIAGRDAISINTSWLFYLLSKNPQIASKIRNELNDVTSIDWTNSKEVNSKLVYLHASLCETLRLYPPVAFEAKTLIDPDTLPSGHNMDPKMKIVFDLYAMGRMKSIWGEDCDEFKPERWISEQGKIKHEPSYKFFVFNAGPRMCLGKDMAFTQMKILASYIIRNYDVEAVDEHNVVPNMSIFLRMKYGFKVKMHRSK